ncbi:hypothetical protein [Paraburkholderia heleia]|uniref:hypothetical protein n=1 Tax=Paraburkholderia heleia TaxID=634127 RepID=UPI0012EDBD83|nr:hypothetical protein [Paraburkholderia heleia]
MSANRATAKEELRKQMLEDSASLQADDSLLGKTLRSIFPHMSRAFVLQWIPEQAEDIYWVLVGRESIVTIEIPRTISADASPSVKLTTVDKYRERRISKITREKLEMALSLI